ncbi:MAG: hypothetical protein H0W72_15300, partial [Planctomycetes bacterium]|nr:hypothetical protein [Planctomycetota bacterium]
MLCLLCAVAGAAELDPARIDATAAELLAVGDRAMGTPGAEQAAALIERRLSEAGLAPMRVRTTIAIARPVGDACRLEVGGQSIPLSAHRSARGSTGGTAGAQVSGPLLFAGQGEDAEFRGKTVEGTIVVLDGDSDDGWTRAAELGAAAVVFSGTDAMDRRRVHRQSVDVSLEFPRFVGDLDRAFDGQVATLHGDLAWTPATAWSVIARIAGTGKHSEAVVMAAAYESPSTIVGRCPGALRAWNAAALLELARSFAAEPPQRDVLVVFHGGRGEMARGLRHLIAGLCLDQAAGVYDPQGQLATLSAELELRLWRDQRAGEALQRFVASHGDSQDALRRLIVDGLGTPPANAGDPATEIEVISARADGFLSLEAGQRADRMQSPLERDRVAASRLPEAERDAARAARAPREAEYTRYRTIQGKLSYGKPLIGEEGGLLFEFATTAASNVGRHLAVLSNQRDDLASLIAARAAFAGATPIHLICLDLSDGNDRYSSLSTGPLVNWANDLGWLHSGLAKLVNDLNRDGDVARIAFETAVYDVQDEAAAWFQEGYVAEAGICGLYIPAATLATVCDARLKHASPMDTAAALDAGNLRTQATGLRRFLAAYVDAGFLEDRKSRGLTSKAPRLEIEVRSLGTKTGRRGYPYPLSFIGTTRDSPDAGDMMMHESHWGDAFGVVRVPFVPEMHNALGQGLPIYSYGYRPDGGIAAALASGGSMKASENLSFTSQWKANDALALLFEGEQSRLYGIFDPRLLVPLAAVSPLSATRDSAPNFTHVETSYEHALSAIWTEPGMRLRITATQGKIGNRLVLTGGATAQRAKGEQGDP